MWPTWLLWGDKLNIRRCAHRKPMCWRHFMNTSSLPLLGLFASLSTWTYVHSYIYTCILRIFVSVVIVFVIQLRKILLKIVTVNSCQMAGSVFSTFPESKAGLWDMYNFFVVANLSANQRLALCGAADVVGGWDENKALMIPDALLFLGCNNSPMQPPVQVWRHGCWQAVELHPVGAGGSGGLQNWTAQVNMSSIGFRYFEWLDVKGLVWN